MSSIGTSLGLPENSENGARSRLLAACTVVASLSPGFTQRAFLVLARALLLMLDDDGQNSGEQKREARGRRCVVAWKGGLFAR